MALAVLFIIGALLGWMASILARNEESRDILRQIGLGAVASVVVGLLLNNGSVIGSLSVTALGAGTAAALAALGVYHAIARTQSA